MKIEDSGKAFRPTQLQAGRPPAETTKKTPASGGSEEVRLSALAATMGKAENAIARTSDIDHKRVEEIRQAIADGHFRIDADRIADGLISSVREMLDAQA